MCVCLLIYSVLFLYKLSLGSVSSMIISNTRHRDELRIIKKKNCMKEEEQEEEEVEETSIMN